MGGTLARYESGVWVRGIGGLCEMCMCLCQGGVGCVGGEWQGGLGLGFTNSVGTRGCMTCACVSVAVVWVVLGEEWVGGLVQGLVGWDGVMSVCAVSLY